MAFFLLGVTVGLWLEGPLDEETALLVSSQLLLLELYWRLRPQRRVSGDWKVPFRLTWAKPGRERTSASRSTVYAPSSPNMFSLSHTHTLASRCGPADLQNCSVKGTFTHNGSCLVVRRRSTCASTNESRVSSMNPAQGLPHKVREPPNTTVL